MAFVSRKQPAKVYHNIYQSTQQLNSEVPFNVGSGKRGKSLKISNNKIIRTEVDENKFSSETVLSVPKVVNIKNTYKGTNFNQIYDLLKAKNGIRLIDNNQYNNQTDGKQRSQSVQDDLIINSPSSNDINS